MLYRRPACGRENELDVNAKTKTTVYLYDSKLVKLYVWLGSFSFHEFMQPINFAIIVCLK